MSFISSPARSSARGTAYAGPCRSCPDGSRAAHAQLRTYPMGSIPSLRIFSSFIRMTAEAPSVRGEEFPAVTEPCFRSNTGRRIPSFSKEESVRMPLSSETTFSKSGGTYTVLMSLGSLPSLAPAAASWCERRAHASCVAREIWFSFAIRSAAAPIVSPVVGSAMAGATGIKSLGRKLENGATRSLSVFPFAAVTRAFENLSLTVIGIRERHSDPPAMTTSAWPTSMSCVPSVIAWFADVQALETVTAGTPFGSTASPTSRAMFGAFGSWTTVP